MQAKINWGWEVLFWEGGGVGFLRKAAIMYKYLLAKLAWGVLTQRNFIWCKVLREKYRMRGENGVQFIETQ